MIFIRRETAEDFAGIHEVNEQAFGQPGEAALVDRLRLRSTLTISLVAVQENQVIGHIAFSPVTFSPDFPALRAVGLAPVAVLPSQQRRGIGSQLVRAGLVECRRAGYGLVLVVGYPAFYHRFGFVATNLFNIRCEYPVPEDAFMLLELQPGALTGVAGVARYQPEFNDV
jgi:putative acetyltransferase